MVLVIGNRSFSNWQGGINYYNNLIRAIKLANDQIHISILKNDCPIKFDSVYDSTIDFSTTKRFSWSWFQRNFLKLLGYTDKDIALLKYPLLKNLIASFQVYQPRISSLAPAIRWIPDFQHVYLKEYFEDEELKQRDKEYREIAYNSDKVIVSSQHARKCFVDQYPEYERKVRVLHFHVSLPSQNKIASWQALKSLYDIPDKFIYLPNQFWKHKNHELVVEALKLDKEKKSLSIISSGSSEDYRNPDHFEYIMNQVANFDLNDQFKYIGNIPYEHVLGLIRASSAILNPSLFEGWSTTVEEARAFEKQLVLSNITVHKEQSFNALFFDPNSPEELLTKLAAVNDISVTEKNYDELREAANKRLISVGNHFLSICSEDSSANDD